MTKPVFIDSFGIEYYNRRVACPTEGCANERIEIEVLAVLGGVIICGVCNSELEPLASGETVEPPVVELPVLLDPVVHQEVGEPTAAVEDPPEQDPEIGEPTAEVEDPPVGPSSSQV